MKFLHLADLHIGRSLGDFDLTQDQRYILEQIGDIAVKRSVDAVLIAGDVYDKPVPSEAAVRLLDSFIKRLSDNHIRIYITSGNHDSDERLGFGSGIFEKNCVFIYTRFDGKAKRYSLKDEYGEIGVYLLPFVKTSQVRHFYPDERIESYEDAVSAVLRHSVSGDRDQSFSDEERRVLVAHQFVTGHGDVSLAGSESTAVKHVGNVEKISSTCFKGFDYVALGHIHAPQRVGDDKIRYAGSPLKYSLSEANSDKSVPVVTVKERGQTEIELVRLEPRRDLRHLKGEMKKLLDKKNITDTDDYIYVTLTDEIVINDAMSVFQQVYPNTVRIDYENSHTRDIERVDAVREIESRSFKELISDFYRQVYSREIGEDELLVMMRAAAEAGIADETG